MAVSPANRPSAYTNISDAIVLESIDDVKLLGDAAFSQCRYITHWAYSLEHESTGWIIKVLGRMGELTGGGDAV